MLTYGFFNSQNSDRTYTAADFNKYFEGVISQNGIFQTVGDAFHVTADVSQLRVSVGSGKALVNSHWVDNSETTYLTLAAADVALDRWDQIVLRCSETNRNVELAVNTGTPSSKQPANIYNVSRTPTTYEILLAIVRVPKASSKITNANITDTRANTKVCGYVTGLVNQVDTSDLYDQWQAATVKMEADMAEWEAEQKTAFEEWLGTLTSDSPINIYLKRESATIELTVDSSSVDFPRSLVQKMTENDVVDIYLNGVYLVAFVDYALLYINVINPETMKDELTGVQIQFLRAPIEAGNTLTINVLKSVIG